MIMTQNEQSRDDADREYFSEWVVDNKAFLLEQYQESEPTPPSTIYDGVLDDEYSDTYDGWIENLEFKDVPEAFIDEQYQAHLLDESDGTVEHER